MLLASSAASAGVRKVMATSTGPKISSCTTVAAGMHVGEQSGRVEAALLRQRIARLPAARAFGHAGVDHLANGLKLHRRNDCADVDGLVERRADAQRFHARADFGVERFGDALLHQQARAGAADLALVEPDGVDQAFDGGVEIGVVEDDERRFAAELEREFFRRVGGGLANDAADFG